MLTRCFACFLFISTFAGAVVAGELSETILGTSISWKPTQCPKPAKLFFHVIDIDSYNAAVEDYNQYLLDVRTYRSCISEEAQRDAKTTAQAIAGGVDQVYDEIRTELDSARSALESAKRLVQ